MLIEKLCRKVFNNRPDPELFAKHPGILFLIADIYLPYCNSENGDYLNLPFGGGIMNQPYMTMKYLDLIKLNYKLFITEQQKQRMQEMKNKKARSRR